MLTGLSRLGHRLRSFERIRLRTSPVFEDSSQSALFRDMSARGVAFPFDPSSATTSLTALR